MSFRNSLSVLNERNFAWFFASRFVNLMGTSMSSLALAFAVLEVTDSPAALGQVMAAHTIPMVAFLLVGGVIADRFPRALVLQFSNLSSAATQFAAAWLIISGSAEIWMLIILEALNGITSAMSFPAMQGLVPQLVPRDKLQPANLLLSMSRGAMTILGPSVAAILVVTVGAGWGLAIDALTWFLAALLLMPVKIPRRQTDKAAPTTAFSELREGWSYFRSTTWLWVVVLAFGFLNAIVSGFHAVAPAYAKQTIGIQAWGLAESASSVGLLVMTVILMRAAMRRPLRSGMIGCATMALPLVVMGIWPETVPVVLASAVAGAGIEIFGLGWSLAMMEQVPEPMQSRAWSYDSLGSFVAMPVGQLAFGPLVLAFGYEEVFVIAAAVFLVICLVTLMVPAVRDLGRVGHLDHAAEPGG